MTASEMGLGSQGWAWGAQYPLCICQALCLAQPHTLFSPFQERLKGGLARPLWSWTTRVASKGFFWWMMTSWG